MSADERQGQVSEPLASALQRVDALDLDGLERVVHGVDGYPRYILGTEEPGPGHDGAYSYEEWAHARRRLAALDMPAGWQHATSDGATVAALEDRTSDWLDVREPDDARTATGTPDDRRFAKKLRWQVPTCDVLRGFAAVAQSLELTVTIAGPRQPVREVDAEQHVGWSDGPAYAGRESHQGAQGPDEDAVSTGALWEALTGQTSGHIGPGVASDDHAAPWLAGGDASDASHEHEALADTRRLLRDALAMLAPELAWLVGYLRVDDSLARIIDEFLNASRGRPLCAEVFAGPPESDTSAALAGGCALQGRSFSCHDGAYRDAESQPENGRFEVMLGAPPGSFAALAFSGLMRPVDPEDVARRVAELVESALSSIADFWLREWAHFVNERRLQELVNHGAHRLMPVGWYARLVSELRAGVCDDTQQRAIVRVLETSLERGELSELLDAIGGDRAASELLWAMDQGNHAELLALFKRANIAC